MRPTTLALATLAAWFCRAAPAIGDGPDGLPTGAPIKKGLAAWFRKQQAEVLGTVATIGTELPAAFPPLTDYDDPMARAMTPILSAYWKESGKKTTGELAARTGLDLGAWTVTNPHTRAAIEGAALSFCAATNATTGLDLNSALATLKEELKAGIVDHGEGLPALRKRVQSVFTAASDSRAGSIAATEASRAVHAAQLAAAEESGVVAGMEWVISDDACPKCRAVYNQARMVPLGQPFARYGTHADYSTVRHPPLHPRDQCSVSEVLSPAYGGPADPDWAGAVDLNAEPDESGKYPAAAAPGPTPAKEAKAQAKAHAQAIADAKAAEQAQAEVLAAKAAEQHAQAEAKALADDVEAKAKAAGPKPKPKPMTKAEKALAEQQAAKAKFAALNDQLAAAEMAKHDAHAEQQAAAAAVPFPGSPDGLVFVKTMGGSTGAQLVEDPATGLRYIRKQGANPGHLREEDHADRLYRAAGANVPDSKLYETGAGPVKLSRFLEGKTLAELRHASPAKYAEALHKLSGHFAVDALLGNWDVVGLGFDNVLVDAQGEVYRIDNGGSLRYRAQGAPKGPGQFGAHVGEVGTLRDPKLNPASARAFAGLSDADVREQAAAIGHDRAKILAAAPAELRAILGERLDSLAAHGEAAPMAGALAPAPGAKAKAKAKVKPDHVDFGGREQTMESWGKEHYAAWASALPADQKEAVREYSASAYTWMNKYHRGDPDWADRARAGGKALTKPEALAMIGRVEAAMGKAAVPEPVVAYRGVQDHRLLGLDLATLAPGDRFAEPSAASTTLHREKASTFSDNGPRPVLLQLRVPAGTPAAYLNTGRLSHYPGERELLIAPGAARYAVVDVDRTGRIPKITVDVLP